jgi:hypothetical protein
MVAATRLTEADFLSRAPNPTRSAYMARRAQTYDASRQRQASSAKGDGSMPPTYQDVRKHPARISAAFLSHERFLRR